MKNAFETRAQEKERKYYGSFMTNFATRWLGGRISKKLYNIQTFKVFTATVLLYLIHTASYTSPYWPPPNLCLITISVLFISHSSGSEIMKWKKFRMTEECNLLAKTINFQGGLEYRIPPLSLSMTECRPPYTKVENNDSLRWYLGSMRIQSVYYVWALDIITA